MHVVFWSDRRVRGPLGALIALVLALALPLAAVPASPVAAAPAAVVTANVTLAVSPAGTVAPGAQLIYTIHVQNTSNAGETLQNVLITDQLPANTTFVSASDGGSISGNLVTFPTFNLAPSAIAQRTLTLTVNPATPIGTTISNTANVFAANLPGIATTNTVTNQVTGSPSGGTFTTSLSVSPQGNVAQGSILTYAVTTTNTSGQTLFNVVVTGPVPAGTIYVPGSGGTLVGSNVTFTTASLAPGQLVTNQYQVTVSGAQGTTISNAASVSVAGQATQTTNTVVNTVGTGSTGQLNVGLAASPWTSVAPGGTIQYTVYVTNATATVINNITVTDTVPAGTTYVAGSGGTYNAATNQVSFTTPVLQPYQSTSYTFAVQATGALGTAISNAATVVSAQTGTQTTNTVVHTIGGSTTQLQVGKIAVAPAGTNPGAQILFTLYYTNTGSTLLNNVVISDNLPIGLTWVPGSGGTPTGTGQSIVFNVGTLVPGQSGQVTFQAAINPGTPFGTPITNTAQATANEVGGVTSNSIIITVGGGISGGGGGTGSGGLQATKSASPPTGTPVSPGQTINYVIQLNNTGSSVISNIVVTDAVPAGTQLLPGTVGAGQVIGNQVQFTIGSLAPGQSVSVGFNVQVMGTGVLPGQPGYNPLQPGYNPLYPGTAIAPGGLIVNTAQVTGNGIAQFGTNQVQHTLLGGNAPVPQPVPVPQPGAIPGFPNGLPPGEGFLPTTVGGAPVPGGALTPLGGAPAPAPGPAPAPAPAPASAPTRAESGSYDATPNPAPIVFLPYLAGGANGVTSAYTVFNASPQANTVQVQYIGVDGTGPRETLNLPPNGGAVVTNVPPGFVGAAVLTGQQPLAATVRLQRQGLDEMSYEGVSSAVTGAPGANTVYLPLLFRRYSGWSTEVAVQNIGTAPAEVTLTYRSSDPAQGGATATETASIPPGGVRVFAQSASPQLTDNFVGGAVVTSTNGQPLAAVVTMTNTGNAAAMAYTGIYGSQAAATIRAPLLMKAHNGWDTGLQVQNVGNQPTTVRVDYTASGQTGIAATESAQLAPGESRTFFTPAAPGLPNDFVGSAVVTSDNQQPLAGVVNQTKYQLGTAMTYTALATGATTLIAPIVFKGVDGYSSGIQVQNLGGQAAQVSLQFFSDAGQPVGSINDSIAANGSATYYLPSVQQLPPTFRGAVVITSQNGQPLGAVVNDVVYR